MRRLTARVALVRGEAGTYNVAESDDAVSIAKVVGQFGCSPAFRKDTGADLASQGLATTGAGWMPGELPTARNMRVEERFRRRDYGHMDLKITITDPKTFTQPIAFSVVLDLMPDTDLLELYCSENEKDDARIRGSATR